MPNRILSYFICASAVLLLSACQSLAPSSDQRVELAPGVALTLQESWPGAPVQVLQQVAWSHPDLDRQELLVSSWLTAEKILMVGLSPLGQELWRLELGPQHPLTVTGIEPFNQTRLAQAIVADMQLHRWPLAELRPHLHGAQITQTAQARRLTTATGKLIWSAITQAGVTTIDHHSAGYQLQLRTLEETGIAADEAD